MQKNDASKLEYKNVYEASLKLVNISSNYYEDVDIIGGVTHFNTYKRTLNNEALVRVLFDIFIITKFPLFPSYLLHYLSDNGTHPYTYERFYNDYWRIRVNPITRLR